MKIKIIISLIACTTLFLSLKKAHAQCENTFSETIHANRIKAIVPSGGGLFYDATNNEPGFFAPYTLSAENPVSTIFASGLWLGGFSENGLLKAACKQYDRFNSDFYAGPIDDNTGNVFPDGCINFNRTWTVTRVDILILIEDYEDNNAIDQTIPKSILQWPGKGNPHFENELGFELPNQDLAPFFDRNNNDIYEPLNGEYPILDFETPEVIPDEMIWCVYNDRVNEQHEGTFGEPIGVEVHSIVFAFSCQEDSPINYTVFTRHKIFNKSNEIYTDFRGGLWLDSDLGCYADDAFGCDSLLNTVYFYNIDPEDGSIFCEGPINPIPTYGNKPPVQTATLLNRKLDKVGYYQNAFSDVAFPVSPPNNDEEYYNYLSGKWKLGTPLTFGLSGYDPTSSDFVNFPYFDNPNDPDGWSRYNLVGVLPDYFDFPVPSVGSFPFFNGDSFTLDFAHTFHRHPDSTHLGNINLALENIPEVQSFYDNGFNLNCALIPLCQDDCVWPGDFNADGIVRENDLMNFVIGRGEQGASREFESFSWGPKSAENWGAEFPNGSNYKHGDGSGDGIIDNDDFYVNELNYRQKRPDVFYIETLAEKKEGELYIDITDNELSTNDNALAREVQVYIELASEAEPFQDISGVSFTLNYDTALFTPSNINSFITIDHPSFFGADDEVLSIRQGVQEEGRAEFGITRKDGQTISPAHGPLFRINLLFREDATTSNSDGTENITLSIYDAFAATPDGTIIPLGYCSDTLLGTDMSVDVSSSFSAPSRQEKLLVEISPNPNNGHFYIFSKNNSENISLELFNLNGQKIWDGKMNSGQKKIDINLSGKISSGVYFLRATDETENMFSQKIIIE